MFLAFALLLQLSAGVASTELSGCVESHGAEGLEATCSAVNEIPSTLSNHTRKLTVVNSHLTVLENGALSHVPRLAVLDLSGNRITHLKPGAFSGLPHLKYLNLARNELCFGDEAFPQEVFVNMTSLRVLVMHSNNCSNGHIIYPDKALGELTNLETLSLNGLPNVPLGSGFAMLKSLKSLELSGKFCNMGSVSNETFASLGNLNVSQLSLRACNVTMLDVNTFTPLPRLTSLNLACNERIGMEEAAHAIRHASTPGLDTVILDDISRSAVILDKRLFAPHQYKTVRRLSLRANDILAVDVRAMYLLPAIRRLAVGYNSIYSMNAFFPRDNLTDLLHNATAKLQLEVVDASRLLSSRSKYRRIFCEPDQVDIEDFFREKPFLDGVTYARPNKPTAYTRKHTSIIPASLQVIFLDHSGYSSYTYSLPKIEMTDWCEMVVFNLSNTDMDVLKGPLAGFHNLQVFDVRNCRIYRIHSGALRELTKLKYLFLQHNVIGEKGDGISDQFHGLSSLLELDLSNNKIPSIQRDAFRDLSRIRKLDLRGNRLTVLGFSVSQMASVIHIDISGNRARYADAGFLEGIPGWGNNTEMDLRNNSFVCNCSSAAFVRWVQTTLVNITDVNDLQCLTDAGQNVDIAGVNAADLHDSCPVRRHRHVGVVIGCLLVISIVLAIATTLWFCRRRRGTITKPKVSYRLFDGKLVM